MSIFDDFSGGDQLDSSSGRSLDGDGVLGSHILTNTCWKQVTNRKFKYQNNFVSRKPYNLGLDKFKIGLS